MSKNKKLKREHRKLTKAWNKFVRRLAKHDRMKWPKSLSKGLG